jgi:hypothetical protein
MDAPTHVASDAAKMSEDVAVSEPLARFAHVAVTFRFDV